ncbi:hypothetical protein [Pseudoduganella sp. R-43]|uniref:hypothetical protein n=1 Tax=unclassified Pseudoduganella TaxID=2637179 RepID=UPI003CF41E77
MKGSFAGNWLAVHAAEQLHNGTKHFINAFFTAMKYSGASPQNQLSGLHSLKLLEQIAQHLNELAVI